MNTVPDVGPTKPAEPVLLSARCDAPVAQVVDTGSDQVRSMPSRLLRKYVPFPFGEVTDATVGAVVSITIALAEASDPLFSNREALLPAGSLIVPPLSVSAFRPASSRSPALSPATTV